MATAVTVLLMVLVMAAAVALVRARRQLLTLIDRSTWVVVVTGLLASAAPLAALITGDYQLTRDTIRKLDVISVGPLAELVTRAGRPVIILVASGAVALVWGPAWAAALCVLFVMTSLLGRQRRQQRE